MITITVENRQATAEDKELLTSGSKGIGVQFDPKLAAILIQMIDDDTEYKMRER